MRSGPAEPLHPERYRHEVTRQVRRRLTVALPHTHLTVWLSSELPPAGPNVTTLHVETAPLVVDSIEWHLHVAVPDEPRYWTDQFVELYADQVAAKLVADVSAWN